MTTSKQVLARIALCVILLNPIAAFMHSNLSAQRFIDGIVLLDKSHRLATIPAEFRQDAEERIRIHYEKTREGVVSLYYLNIFMLVANVLLIPAAIYLYRNKQIAGEVEGGANV
jgi:hypothetical protein